MSFIPPQSPTPEEGLRAPLQMMKLRLREFESLMVTWTGLKTTNEESQGLKPVISDIQTWLPCLFDERFIHSGSIL